MTEEWRGIASWMGLYEVSNFGRVRSLPRPSCRKGFVRGYPGQVLSGHFGGSGYYQVTLCDRSIPRLEWPSVHRLVALAFIPNPLALPQVNHRNGVKTDNRVENLEWVNQSQNNKHAVLLGLAFRGELNAGAKLTERDIAAIRNAPRRRGVQTRLAEIYGVKQPTISKIILGKRWRHIA